MISTIATLFSGGEGVGVGAQQAGVKHLWGIEYDADIAAVAQMNGFAATVADVTSCDPDDFERPDILHASPPCPNFSTAKTDRGETGADIAMGLSVCGFIHALRPDVFTLENVYGYRNSQSFKGILMALHLCGYKFNYWHLNAADYGVPQTRKRLFLVALKGGTPQRPPATHQDPSKIVAAQMGMFGAQLPPWIGWYEAIEDLIPTLPESQFAPWQLKRLDPEILRMVRALLINSENAHQEWGGLRDGEDPAMTLAAKSKPRAFIVDGCNAGGDPTTRRSEPYFSVTAESHKGMARAFLVGGQYGQPAGTPNRSAQCTDGPAFTVTAVNKGDWTGAAAGHVVQMTPRALARFQSFPDWYELPEKKSLACHVVGNAVPPLLYQRVIESVLEQLRQSIDRRERAE